MAYKEAYDEETFKEKLNDFISLLQYVNLDKKGKKAKKELKSLLKDLNSGKIQYGQLLRDKEDDYDE